MLVAKTKGPDEWKAVTSAISTLVEEAAILGIIYAVINFLIFTKNNILKKSRNKTYYDDNMELIREFMINIDIQNRNKAPDLLIDQSED